MSTNRSRLGIALVISTLLAVPALASTLTGGFDASSDPIDLTAEGGLDWAHWVRLNDSAGGPSPDQTPYPTERKDTLTPLISDLAAVDGGTLADVGARNGLYSWTDGTNVPVGDTTNQGHANGFDRAPSYGINVAGAPALRFTVMASDTELRVLRLYVSVFDSQATLSATLPGVSNYVHGVTPADNTAEAGVFTITFQADNPGDVLTLWWKKTADYGNLDNGSIEAAAVSVVPEPASLLLLALGGLALRRR